MLVKRMPQKSKLTLQTIADECGVSRTTVSNAFSRPDQLSDELRNQVLATAERLGYTGPHPGARSLRKGKAGAIGVVLEESLSYALHDAHAIEFLGGMAEFTHDPPLALTLIPGNPIGADGASPISSALVDGFCLFSLPDGHPAIQAALARKLPTIIVDYPRLPGQPFVGIDDEAAMRQMIRAVLLEGHTDIVLLTFRLLPDNAIGPVSTERIHRARFGVTRVRVQAALTALAERGVEPRVYEIGVNTRASARTGAADVLRSGSPPTAFICMSDQMALGTLDAAVDLGLRVPDHLSITGFDDIAEAESAGITTIRQSATEKGRLVAELLASGAPRTVILPHEIVRRRSLGPPPT
jgi:DNA-binding LacI/PurR family transcriptional regulator